ncbi:acyl-CoA dehydrogenase family protein [Azorhizobium sp. AG788]|uniref:acyl-CoA dehydrogenase family protein n=1 Tax=Azorhizobium sp. AG788 TaxID=2183897 RepID=UPI003139C0B9
MTMNPIPFRPVASKAPQSAEPFFGRLRAILDTVAAHAADLDHDEASPREDIDLLAASGALLAPLAPSFGGQGFGLSSVGAGHLARALRLIGWASLPLGRLYEGHVNALALIQRFGTPEQIGSAAESVREGKLYGVWNTESTDAPLRIEPDSVGFRLRGGKTFASGAGFVACPLVTARISDGPPLMILPPLGARDLHQRADMTAWRAHGMRASASGAFDFSGLAVTEKDIVGAPGDYHAQPHFSGGAWRFLAVQLGGIERLVDEARGHLRSVGRDSDPHQVARMAQAAAAAETARLWVDHASERAEQVADGAGTIAYVNLARGVVERAGLDVLELVHRSVGLPCFQRSHPIERISRDLATYLRQPAPDRALAEAGHWVLQSDGRLADFWP